MRSPRYFAWDPTRAFDADNATTDWSRYLYWADRYGRAVYQPARGPRGSLEQKFDRWCEDVLRRSNAMAFIDEPGMLDEDPQSHRDLVTLGHKRGLGVMTATHRLPDLEGWAQMVDHFFVFRMPLMYDVYQLYPLVGKEGAQWIRTAPQWHFWYRGTTQSYPSRPVPWP